MSILPVLQVVGTLVFIALLSVSFRFFSRYYACLVPNAIETLPAALSGADTSSQLFAVIVGINDYKSKDIRNLRGGIADAESFRQYLQDDLKIPQSQIHFLTDESATRANILQTLGSLENDERIQPGDPILIFFAGHGAQADPPEGWDARKIELLVPHDFGPQPGIPDHELGKLLNDIAKKKGNNITVILDSCHSASGTRGPSYGALARCIDIPVDYVRHSTICKRIVWGNADNDVSSRTSQTASGFSLVGLNSHILLAACKSTELALESNSRGHFSAALLDLFRSKGLRKLKYSDILKDINIGSMQNPQCLGYYQDRFIFDQKVFTPPQPKIFPVKTIEGTIVIEAGAAEGIANGDEFAVYDQNRTTKLGILTVEKSQCASSLVVFHSLSQETPYCPSSAISTRTKIGKRIPINLYIHPDPTGYLKSLFEEPENNLHNFCIVSRERDARAAMQLANQEVVLRVSPQILKGHQFKPPSYTIQKDSSKLVHILLGVADYFWHLERCSQNNEVPDSVEVEFYQLEERDGAFHTIGPNLNIDNIIELTAKPDVPYGIKLTNKSRTDDFYPYLYYFDGSELNIASYFQSPLPSVGKCDVECPLPKGGVLTVGYGSGGAPPFEYYLPDGQDVDLGTLKMFLFTKPIDQRDIPRPSPFQEVRRAKPLYVEKKLAWGTITIPIIQLRH